jgi:hypothetical protein
MRNLEHAMKNTGELLTVVEEAAPERELEFIAKHKAKWEKPA